ncbi:MAG: hypothetical protein QXS48_03510 [Candidatus Aenigmatarchaeota archaeon]
MKVELSSFFKEACELYELLTISKCRPIFDSFSSFSLNTRNDNLSILYHESYFPFKKSYFSTWLTTSLTFFDFNEKNLEHQRKLKLALSKLQKTFSDFHLGFFYKEKLISYRSPLYLGEENQKYIFNQYLLDIYRETVENLFELDFVKSSYIEFDVTEKNGGRCVTYGRFLFLLQDKLNESLKRREMERRAKLFLKNITKDNSFSQQKIKKCMDSIFNPANYEEGRFFLVTPFKKKFNFDLGEFEKLKRLLEKYNFKTFLQNSQENYINKVSKLTEKEIKELLLE